MQTSEYQSCKTKKTPGFYQFPIFFPDKFVIEKFDLKFDVESYRVWSKLYPVLEVDTVAVHYHLSSIIM